LIKEQQAAFLMGTHERAGVNSPMFQKMHQRGSLFDPQLIRAIFNLAKSDPAAKIAKLPKTIQGYESEIPPPRSTQATRPK
jgi:hypothetical protein